MKIESMTATFGKLNTQTLTLKPGLNVLEMPNETGKSTWCAFLLSMLYGVDTSERETRTNLPLKKHYAPWSGMAMEGQICLEQDGRRITIERSSTARTPLGVFRAFNTESGQAIPELNGQNCGEVLLGIPRQVFVRSAFLRQDGIAIGMDANLEQRLNALVTTGDETISYQQAEQLLRERRNRCRHNKTGLIPQTEAALAAVNERLERLDALHESMAQARCEEQQLRSQQGSLRMQIASLQAAQASERRTQLQNAKLEASDKIEKAKQLKEACERLPEDQVLHQWEQTLSDLQSNSQTLALDFASLPPKQKPPALPPAIVGLSEQEIRQKSTVDASRMKLLQAQKKPTPLLWMLLSALLLIGCAALAAASHSVAAICAAVAAGLIAAAGALVYRKKKLGWMQMQNELLELYTAYGARTPNDVESCCDRCLEAMAEWQLEVKERNAEEAALNARKEQLDLEYSNVLTAINLAFTETLDRKSALPKVRSAMALRVESDNAHRMAQQAYRHYCDLKEAIGDMPIVTTPTVAVPEGATLSSLQNQIHSTESKLSQVRTVLDRGAGQCSTLGDPMELEARKQALSERLETLNLEYDALCVALTTLGKSNEALQSRLAPQLTALASEYLSQLTDGTYSQMMLDRNLNAALFPKDTAASRDASYFSGGTQDQLYFAVRLAFSKLLAPKAPLILDDALVRFDDIRMKKALEVLKKEAKCRQILLFTCQSREKAALAEL